MLAFKGRALAVILVTVMLSISVSPMIFDNSRINEIGTQSSQPSIPWYNALEKYAQEHGTTVEQLTANWTADDWWRWYKYEGNPSWGSTNITDQFLATDWVKLPNSGNLTWGANYNIQAKFNSSSGYLDWIGKSNNFSAFNLKSTASYIIWKEGSTYYATNGTTGLIDYSGADATTVIQSAIDNTSMGSDIFIKSGDYTISSLTIQDCRLIGEGNINYPLDESGGVVFTLSGNDGITVKTSASLNNVLIKTGTSFTGTALTVNSYTSGDDTSRIKFSKVLDDIYLYNPNNTGTGLLITADASNNTNAIDSARFGKIVTYNFEYAVKLYATETAPKEAWINGNLFDNIFCYYPTYGLTLEANGTAQIVGNTFIGVYIQANSGSVYGVKFIKSSQNSIMYLRSWDWSVATDDALIFDADSSKNIIYGYIQSISDASDGNMITNLYNNWVCINGSVPRLGIGTNTPVRGLHVATGGMRLERTGADPYMEWVRDGAVLAQVRGYGSNTGLKITNGIGSISYVLFRNENLIFFNADKQDIDFRIQGSGENYLFFADAGNDRVGIGTSTPNSLLQINGSLAVKRTATAANYTTLGETIIGVTDTTVARTITLASSDCVDGRLITIKDESGGAGTYSITIATEGSETIDGSSTVTINSNYGYVNLYSDGSNWFVMGGSGYT